MNFLKNIEDLGFVLPKIKPTAASFVPYRLSGNTVTISGQLPVRDGTIMYKGKVGDTVAVGEAQDAARLCVLSIVSHLHHACDGDLQRVKKCVRLGGFVNCIDTFTEQPVVINAASDLILSIFGPEVGAHARAAVGVNSLPFGVSVEVEAIFEIS